MFKEFKQFLLRGNVVDLAVGVVVGAAFGTIITALVNDLLSPLISVIAKVPDFAGLSFVVRDNQFMYGDFLNAIISFALVAIAVFFFVIKPMNLLITRSHEGPLTDSATKECSECLSEIPLAAKRCSHCTQLVD